MYVKNVMKVIITKSKEIELNMYLLQTVCFKAVKKWTEYIDEIIISKEFNDTNKILKELIRFVKITVKSFDTVEEMTDYADALIVICENENKEIRDLIKMAKKKRLMIYVYRTTS